MANGVPAVSTVGAQAATSWLSSRRIATPGVPRWHVEIAMGLGDDPLPIEFDERATTRLHLAIHSEEWSVYFCHAGRWSWIRITDIAFIHTRDDFGLLTWVPPLDQLGALLRRIERDHHVAFRRDRAVVRTNLANAEPAIRSWLATL
jgi:hypothetical protein